jgi:predicted transcriptional regulator
MQVTTSFGRLPPGVALTTNRATAAPYTKPSGRAEKASAQVRVRVDYLFWEINRQVGYVRKRLRGLAKNDTERLTLLALSHLGVHCRHLMIIAGEVRLYFGDSWREVLAASKNKEMSKSSDCFGSTCHFGSSGR